MSQIKVTAFLNKMEGFKTAAVNAHWDSSKDVEHRLMEELSYTLNRFQDSIAEIWQGAFDIKIAKNKLKAESYKFTSHKKFIKDIRQSAVKFYKSLPQNNKLIGLRSKLEEFIAEMDVFNYKITFILNESKVNQIIREGLLKYGKLI